jgi:hypothetical protein
MATTPEGKIKRWLDKMLKEEGVWFYSPQAGPFGVAGIPDRMCCAAGHLIGVETKADKTKKPTALQMKCMRDIEAAGGKCFVAYDKETIETVREYIRACNSEGQSAGVEAEEPGAGDGDDTDRQGDLFSWAAARGSAPQDS